MKLIIEMTKKEYEDHKRFYEEIEGKSFTYEEVIDQIEENICDDAWQYIYEADIKIIK